MAHVVNMNSQIPSLDLAKRVRSAEDALKISEGNLRLARDELEKNVHDRVAEVIRTNRALQAEITERKEAEKEALEIAQKEQQRFGSQLHDGLCQELTSILLFAKALTQKMERENKLELEELKKISDMLLEAVDQARDTARGLYPGELEGASLMHTLEELVARTDKLSESKCRFYCPEKILINDNNVATHLYRIAQEGISNALNHGKAKLIEVFLTKKDGIIYLSIHDDGVGFSKSDSSSKGIGLNIMKYRAHMMDAVFLIEANVPHGVILKCTLKEVV